MITIVLLFFGAVFFYTGVLALERDPTAAIGAGILGMLLVAQPAMKAIGYLRANYSQPSQTASQRRKHRKTHLRVVEPRDKKPTIH